MNKHVIIYGTWLLMVIGWNFGYSQATPLLDVVAAVVLATFSTFAIHRFVHKKDWR